MVTTGHLWPCFPSGRIECVHTHRFKYHVIVSYNTIVKAIRIWMQLRLKEAATAKDGHLKCQDQCMYTNHRVWGLRSCEEGWARTRSRAGGGAFTKGRVLCTVSPLTHAKSRRKKEQAMAAVSLIYRYQGSLVFT